MDSDYIESLCLPNWMKPRKRNESFHKLYKLLLPDMHEFWYFSPFSAKKYLRPLQWLHICLKIGCAFLLFGIQSCFYFKWIRIFLSGGISIMCLKTLFSLLVMYFNFIYLSNQLSNTYMIMIILEKTGKINLFEVCSKNICFNYSSSQTRNMEQKLNWNK